MKYVLLYLKNRHCSLFGKKLSLIAIVFPDKIKKTYDAFRIEILWIQCVAIKI